MNCDAIDFSASDYENLQLFFVDDFMSSGRTFAKVCEALHKRAIFSALFEGVQDYGKLMSNYSWDEIRWDRIHKPIIES